MAMQYLHTELAKNLTRIFDEYQSMEWSHLVSEEGPTIGEHCMIVGLYDWISTGEISRSLMQFLYLLTRDNREAYQIVGYETPSDGRKRNPEPNRIRYEVEKVPTQVGVWHDTAMGILDLESMNQQVTRHSPGSKVIMSLCLECATVVPSLAQSPSSYCSAACKTNASEKQEDGSHRSRWKGLKYWDSGEVIDKAGRVVDSQHQLLHFSRLLGRALSINAGIDFSKRINKPFTSDSRKLNQRWGLLFRSHGFKLRFLSGDGNPHMWGVFDVVKSPTGDKKPTEPDVVMLSNNPAQADIDLEVKALNRLFEVDPDDYWGEEGESRRKKLNKLTGGRHPMCNPLILTETEERKRYLTDPTLKPTVNYKVSVADSDSATIWSRPKAPNSRRLSHTVDFGDVRHHSRLAYLDSQKKPAPFQYENDIQVPALILPKSLGADLTEQGVENLIDTVKGMYRQDILTHISREVRDFHLVEKELQDQFSTDRYTKLMKSIERAVFDAMKRVNDDPDYVPFDLNDIREDKDPIDVPRAIAEIFKQ